MAAFPFAMIKHLVKATLRKEGFVLAQDEDIVHDGRDSTVTGR